MTFNPVDHPRATDGTFAEKVGASPEIVLPRDEGAGIIYTGLDVLQYAKDYYEEDWQDSDDRESIIAKRRDEYLTYRQTVDGLDEASRYYENWVKPVSFDGEQNIEVSDLPPTIHDAAIYAAQETAADDAEGIRRIYALSKTASDKWDDTEFADELTGIINSKLLTDVRKLPQDEQGNPVYDTEAVARREKYHRAAQGSLELLSASARIPADLDHWGRVHWAAEGKRTKAELAKVLLTESEGEFARVVLHHHDDKVTPEMMTYMARSNDGAVQHAVINHPKVTAAALQEVQARVERDYQEAIDPNNAWGTMKPHYDRQAEQAISFMKDISDARGRLGAKGA